MSETRSDREIRHGEFLADNDPEQLWGWSTPAGKLRARRRAELIARGGELATDLSILEIGCGSGVFTEMFSSSGARITAVDLSPQLLGRARARDLPENRVRFIEKRFEDCDREGPFDAVVGSSILHHLSIPDAIGDIFRLLKPGGLMSFAEPNMLNPQVFLERHARGLFSYVSPDETAFVRFSLSRELRRVGFERVEITPFDWLHPATPERIIPGVQWLCRILERFPVIREFAGSLWIRAKKPI
jgi:2-polyprenyl-3-methyl-5-hydroxy-6-metoxy-1,4-benzoquinol methylase